MFRDLIPQMLPFDTENQRFNGNVVLILLFIWPMFLHGKSLLIALHMK